MTTYPLSEPATIYSTDEGSTKQDCIVGTGTLAECAQSIEGFPLQKRMSVRIEMDKLSLQFGPQEIDELLRFLRNESPGLSNREISAIADPTR